MTRTAMIRHASPFLLVASIAAAACGDATLSAPQLSEVTLSQPRVRPGEQIFATVHATDPDGDLRGGRIDLEVRDVETTGDQLDLDQELSITTVPAEATSADLIVGLRIFGRKPAGEHEISLTVTDASGLDSEPATTRVTCSYQ